ncbi:MAG: WecB/TagA/CpsF family glycosyltransferase [Candidatus Gastranaerophilales bacterium]|nr:WecB/TagA/CpsF family glycosyltransferase [Candidatus Gastranaerophilales bacterium]
MSQEIGSNNLRACILGYPVDLVNMDDAVCFADNYIKKSTGGHVVTLNPEMIMQGEKNTQLSTALKSADLIIPDGIGIIKALNKLEIKHIKQLPGIEFSEKLISTCAEKGYTIAFLGASKDTVDIMVKNLKEKYPSINIIFARDGYFDENAETDIIGQLADLKPDVLFIALGVPKQELWILKYKNTLNSTLMVGVGGSFDVWANKVKRAPFIFRKFGLEWFFRLISQPSRFSRMFPTLPLFFIKVALDNKNTRKEF